MGFGCAYRKDSPPAWCSSPVQVDLEKVSVLASWFSLPLQEEEDSFLLPSPPGTHARPDVNDFLTADVNDYDFGCVEGCAASHCHQQRPERIGGVDSRCDVP